MHDIWPVMNFVLILIVIWSVWRERSLRMPYERLFDEVIKLRVEVERQRGNDRED